MSADDSPKVGAAHASAMWRQGLRELRGALYPESNVAQHSEYGLYGTLTPGEVAESRREGSMDGDRDSGSVLDSRLQQAEGRDVHGRDDKEMEPDR